MSREKVYAEIKEMFGLVPAMFKELPDSSLEMEWKLFKKVQFEKGAIPNKYRELMGLAISAITKCKYCIFYHTALAKLNGATKEEIEDALHYAKSSVGWSAYISGMQIDFEQFKREINKACEHVKKTHAKKMPAVKVAAKKMPVAKKSIAKKALANKPVAKKLVKPAAKKQIKIAPNRFVAKKPMVKKAAAKKKR